MSQLGLPGAIARWIILRAQKTPLKGAGGYSGEAFAQRGDTRPFPQADSEAAQFEEFFKLFPDFPVKDTLKDKEVLDFGSGYGGRTVEYKLLGAKRVCGVEPFENPILLSQKYAETRGVHGVEFKVCGHKEIPYPDESFDIVISFDVLEHVQDPRASVAEIRRVLRPGGMSFNVFPVYLGALSHHLNYIVNLPGLHWIFSARTLVQAVNSILVESPRYGTAPQPEPRLAFDGSQEVLPSLNGLSGRHLDQLFEGFETISLQRHVLFARKLGWITKTIARSGLPFAVRDAVTASVSCILRKPL
jgi:SAM-dependent methyltransferase